MRCSFIQKVVISIISVAMFYFISHRFHKDEFNCREILHFLNISTNNMLIWDRAIIQKIGKNQICTIDDFSEKMAVPVDVVVTDVYPFLTFESSAKTNYYIILKNGKKHGIHKYWHNMRRLLFPTNFTLFEKLWKRSSIIDCLDLKMARNTTTKHGWDEEKTLTVMESLTHHFVRHGMFTFLADGTLLGWYRECSFIPHTKDVDLAYMAEEYNQKAFESIIQGQTEFRPLFRYGQHLVDLEYTLLPSKKENEPRIDVFQINFNGNSSYSTCFRGRTRIVFTFPQVYDPYCAVDFRGRLFWATCSPDFILTSTYGDYKKDLPTSKYNFDRDTKNFKRSHTYTELEWKTTMFKHYKN